ncbi:LuxR C-terminal-related transcriptional regulator [Pseudomonas sp. NY15181]|uniref:helix-turn-helix transcriptional regulator n=1 Tax=Pseudomonas sp. NY15181 TaxID=3400349 RepID=UPI003A86E6ED
MTFPTLSSLVSVPAIHLPRERLSCQVIAAPRLCLLAAPAGFGKTALLRESLAQMPAETGHAWVALHGRCLEVEELTHLLAEQLGLAPRITPEALRMQLCQSSVPRCLILDDYPAAAGELDDWLLRLLQECGPRIRLWISTRQRPRWQLARLALEGGVVELGAASLAFTREEFERLVGLAAGGSRESSIEDLWDATQGWPAMVHLGLRSPGERGRSQAMMQREYVRETVLARLTTAQRAMLLGAAHLPRLSSALCAELWPELEASRDFSGQLLPLGLLLPLGAEARWWQLQPLLAKALEDELPPREASRLRLQGCRLLREAGFVGEAVELALKEGQVETAACYMERVHLAWLYAGRNLDSWLSWRERLSCGLLESTPFLIYLNAQALLISWRLEEAEACIGRLAWQLPQPSAGRQRRMPANWQALQGSLLGLRGDAEQAREHCLSALRDLDARDWQSVHLCYSTLARIAMSEGQVAQSEKLLDQAVRLARRQGCLASEVLIDADRIRLLIMTGEWTLAADLLRHDFQLLEAQGMEHPLLAGRLYLLQAELALLQGDLADAEVKFRRGYQYARSCSDPFLLHAGVGLSEAAARGGDVERAEACLREIRRHLQCMRAEAVCYEPVLALQELRLGVRRQRWAEILEPSRQLVERLSRPGVLPPLNTPSLRYRAQQVLALTLEGLGRREAALEASRNWREACERRGLAGLTRSRAEMLVLVRQGVGGDGPWLPTGAGEELSDATLTRVLTPREMGVLQLMAEGLTNQEISGRLFISLNTVKAHTIHINHKLGVKRRTQAVRRARELGLLA